MSALRTTRLLAAALAAALLFGCAGQGEQDKWLAGAKLDAEESPEQLYAQALEEGPLVVYTESTRILQVRDSFLQAYPGLEVEVHHLRAADLLDTLRKNAELETYHCDVAICTDSMGIVTQELIPERILYKYIPPDIAPHIAEQYNADQFEFISEINLLFYNSEIYRAPPLENWWELTELPFFGRVLMSNPEKSQSMRSLVAAVLQNSDLMEQSYCDFYGVPLSLPPGVTAGEYFWQELLSNGLELLGSGDEVVERIGAPGQTDPPVGFINSGKVRNNDLAYRLDIALDLEPFAGAHYPYSVMLAGGSRNVAAAKLFVRWLLGEADGTGAGFAPFHRDGVWPARTDISAAARRPLDTIKMIGTDKAALYRDREAIIAFWRDAREQAAAQLY